METTALVQGFNEAQISVLTQKTPPELIQQFEGKGGKTFDYLPHEEVTRILNKAFNFQWDTEVKQFGIIPETECWVLLRLLIFTEKRTIVKEQFGGCEYIKNNQGKIVMTTNDCLKAAASDALTKCASLLGIGLDLYGVTGRSGKNGNRNGHNGNGHGNINHFKAEVKRTIGQLKQQPNGSELFRNYIIMLNQANTFEALERLKHDAQALLPN